jgi:hypothetical protein
MDALATITTTGGPDMATTDTKSPPGTILLADIARFWTEERRKKTFDAEPIKYTTVLSYLKESRGGRYADNPMPMPAGYLGTARQAPWWPADAEKELRDWYINRPGHGHGTGGRYAGRAAKVAKPAKRRKGTGKAATVKP